MGKKNKYFIQDGMISKFDFMDNQEFYPLTTLCNMLNDNDEKYDNLAKKFVIVSKAFELFCKDTGCMGCPLDSKDCDSWRGVEQGCSKAIHDYYITKAKEMVENE